MSSKQLGPESRLKCNISAKCWYQFLRKQFINRFNCYRSDLINNQIYIQSSYIRCLCSFHNFLLFSLLLSIFCTFLLFHCFILPALFHFLSCSLTVSLAPFSFSEFSLAAFQNFPLLHAPVQKFLCFSGLVLVCPMLFFVI